MARESCADHDPGGVPTAPDEAVAPATQQAEVLAGEDTTDAPEPAQPSPPADANQETDAETVAGHEGDTDSLSDPVVVAEVASAPVSADPVVVSSPGRRESRRDSRGAAAGRGPAQQCPRSRRA
jgi:hypothetical protein